MRQDRPGSAPAAPRAEAGGAPAVRFLVFGGGAIGATLAAALRRAGHPVGVVDPDPAVRKARDAEGLPAWTPGEVGARVRADGDVGVVATPLRAFPAVVACVPEALPLVVLSNGDGALAVGRAGALLRGVVDLAASLDAEGRARVTRRGRIFLERGEGPGAQASRVLARALGRGGLAVRRRRDVEPVRLAKLALNAAFDPACAVSDLDYGAVLAHRAGRRLVARLLAESVAVARREGVSLAAVGGVGPATLARLLTLPAGIDRLVGTLGRRGGRGVESAMRADLRRGRVTEVRELNGAWLQRGERLGLALPAHARVLQEVELLERGRTTARPDRLARLCAELEDAGGR